MLMVTPSRVQRPTSRSVSSIVRRVGGYEKSASPFSRCAVGSPSVTISTWRLPPRCRDRSWRASISPACMLVPTFHSLHDSVGSSADVNSRA